MHTINISRYVLSYALASGQRIVTDHLFETDAKAWRHAAEHRLSSPQVIRAQVPIPAAYPTWGEVRIAFAEGSGADLDTLEMVFNVILGITVRIELNESHGTNLPDRVFDARPESFNMDTDGQTFVRFRRWLGEDFPGTEEGWDACTIWEVRLSAIDRIVVL